MCNEEKGQYSWTIDYVEGSNVEEDWNERNKAFQCQTEDFILDPRCNKELLEFSEIGKIILASI